MSKKVILFFVGFLVFLNFVCWREVFALQNRKYLAVNFLNVGQGDSAFIETPQGHQILIDGGPDNSAEKELVKLMPFWDRTLDLVVLTHPESDHMRGLLDVLQKYKADYILWTGVKKSAEEYDKWTSVLEKQKKRGAEILIAKSGQKVMAGDLEINTMFPFESLEGFDITKSANDTCIVNKLIYGKDSFLFTGDITSDTEEKLAESGENISTDVLKVAHHGSKYSTSNLFLGRTKPEIAVISVGENSYGHPTTETLQRLADSGAETLRTDQLGDITILSDGQNIKIK